MYEDQIIDKIAPVSGMSYSTITTDEFLEVADSIQVDVVRHYSCTSISLTYHLLALFSGPAADVPDVTAMCGIKLTTLNG